MSSGRGIVRRRLDDHEATATAPDGMADLRARIGDEAVDQFQRSMVLHRQPRPLASDQARNKALTPGDQAFTLRWTIYGATYGEYCRATSASLLQPPAAAEITTALAVN
jgi:hypothetical protein